MRIYLDFPIELGQEYRYKTVTNFRNILNYIKDNEKAMKHHKTDEKHAHKAKQIDYNLTNVHDELQYQDGRIDRIVTGHNGDGLAELNDARTSLDGTNHELLSTRLKYDYEILKTNISDNYKELNDKIQRFVNVNDCGADPTGVTDSTQAFVDAMGNGNVHVHMTAGTYIVSGIKLPSNTILSGEGKDVTIIKLSDDAPAENIVITNQDLTGNAHQIGVENFTIDGNRHRQGNVLAPAGGSRSSNLRFAGVTHGYAYNIKSIDSLLHGIDVTFASDDYFYQGDGVRVNEELESYYIHIDKCETSGFGDDGITTHHSRYLLITDCYSHHSKGSGNSNGIEVDDASQHVVLDGNKTEMNYGGLEIKGHADVSAASNVLVTNHMSIHDTRAYNFRHIGHHIEGDPMTLTAHSITLSNCTAIEPYPNEVFPSTTSRALVISGYRNVHINNFTAVGDGKYSSGNPVIAVQYNSGNIMLNGLNITGFKQADADVKIFGGDNKGKKITISNVNIWDSSSTVGIEGGSGIYDLRIINANLQGQDIGTGLLLYNNNADVVGVSAEGYSNNATIAGRNYSVVPSNLKGGFSGGSTGGGAIAERSAVLASSGGSYAHSDRSWVIGSGADSDAYGSRSGIINSLESRTLESSFAQTIVGSRGVESRGNYAFLMGYGDDGAKYENTTVDISATSGNIKTKGTVSTGQNFGDYAEYFESQSGQEIPNGYIVTLDGRYIRKANSNDVPYGIVSGTAGVILGDQLFHHKSKHLKDEFGVTLTEEVTNSFVDENRETQEETVIQPIKNPEYVEMEDDYIPRSERPEWNVVGLVGQVFTRIDSTVSQNDLIKPNKGIGTKDNVNGYYRVLEVTTPYDIDKGYGVAVVLIK